MRTAGCANLPQAIRNLLPWLVNQPVSTIRETSLGCMMGSTERFVPDIRTPFPEAA